MADADSETLADLVRRTSRIQRISPQPQGETSELQLLIVELCRSEINAVIYGIYRWTSNALASQDDSSVDLTNLALSGNLMNNRYLSKHLTVNISSSVCIFDELLLIDPMDLVQNIPEKMDENIMILQEADAGVLMASVYQFLEETTAYSAKLKLMIIICSEEVAKAVSKLLIQWKPQWRLLIVTNSFDRKCLEKGMTSAGMKRDEETKGVKLVDLVKPIKKDEE